MLHTLLIALAVIGGIAAIVALCIIITRRQTARKNQQLQNSYRALLAQHNLNPEFSQVLGHRILALDSARGVFAYVQHSEALPSAVVELAEVADCRLWKDGVQVSRKKGEAVEEYISTVGLSFRQRSGTAVNLPVYTEVLDGIEDKLPLTKVAEQWQGRINAALASGNKPLLKAL